MSCTPPSQVGSVPLVGVVRMDALPEVPSEASSIQSCPVGLCPSALVFVPQLSCHSWPLGKFVGLMEVATVTPSAHRSSCPSATKCRVSEDQKCGPAEVLVTGYRKPVPCQPQCAVGLWDLVRYVLWQVPVGHVYVGHIYQWTEETTDSWP